MAKYTVEQITEVLAQSKKYKSIDTPMLTRTAQAVIKDSTSLKEAIKLSKRKLHQIITAFGTDIPYASLTTRFTEAGKEKDSDVNKAICQSIMRFHASTRERIPILEKFYTTLFVDIAPVHSVLDLACGLHPFAFPWMQLAPQATYIACDISSEMMKCIGVCLEQSNLRIQSLVQDITQGIPNEEVEIAFLLKTIPTIDQQDETAGRRILEQIHAKHIILSFPVRSLSGREKGMKLQYTQRLETLVAGLDFNIQHYVLGNEIVFHLTRSSKINGDIG
jgi:16S rRNA (guanine(1405)-N(7))-methyltransferase